MQPSRVKPPTRGAQQILKENAQTIRTYKYLVVGAIGFRWLSSTALALSTDVSELLTLSLMSIISDVFMPSLILVLFGVMNRISKPIYSVTNEKTLISPGYDLNMKSGAAEHYKDILLVFVLTHLLTMIHNIFFVALALLPIRGLYLFCVCSAEPFFGMHPEGVRRGAKLFLHIFCTIFVATFIYTLFFHLYPFF